MACAAVGCVKRSAEASTHVRRQFLVPHVINAVHLYMQYIYTQGALRLQR